VNIPNLPDDLAGAKVVRLGRRNDERVIHAGQTRVKPCTGSVPGHCKEASGTDFHAAANKFISICPQIDLTDHERLSFWAPTAARLAQPA
jgi:5'-nucleotidase